MLAGHWFVKIGITGFPLKSLTAADVRLMYVVSMDTARDVRALIVFKFFSSQDNGLDNTLLKGAPFHP